MVFSPEDSPQSLGVNPLQCLATGLPFYRLLLHPDNSWLCYAEAFKFHIVLFISYFPSIQSSLQELLPYPKLNLKFPLAVSVFRVFH